MVRWWRARSWEQKLGMITLVVTVLGTLIVPVYLATRDDGGSPERGAASPASGSAPSLESTTPPSTTTATDPTTGSPPTSGAEPEQGQPRTPDGKVVRYLSDMQRVEGQSPYPGSYSINGVAHAHSLTFEQYGTTSAVEFDLGRGFDTFEATIGLRDDSSAAGRTKFEVFLDGRTAAAKTVAFGRAVKLELPVSGVLRLRLVATPVHAQPVRVFSTWGDGRLLGDPAKVPPTT